MNTLSIDLETFCELDLSSVGIYRYTEHPSFEIMLMAYAYNDEPVQIIDLTAGERLPEQLIADILGFEVEKHAWNANFERVCLSRWLLKMDYLIPDAWFCTLVKSSYHGLPASLSSATKALFKDKDMQKMDEGKELITYFCKPCKPTKANGGRTRNLPHHAPEKWETFKKYCIRDVETERRTGQLLDKWPMPERIWHLYHLDQLINDRGLQLDKDLALAASEGAAEDAAEMVAEAIRITGLENPNSTQQIISWLESYAIFTKSIDKDSVEQLLKTNLPDKVRSFLLLRQDMSKASIKKYGTMLGAVNNDGRIRGALSFYAAHSGRWAGRLYQLHNLIRIMPMFGGDYDEDADLDYARELVKARDLETVKLIYGSVAPVVSNLVRTVLVAKSGYHFINCDMSQIEARLLAWACGNTWALEAFASGKDIYIAVAEQMYKVPAGTITKKDERRQRGKTTQLACGYQGSAGAMRKMDKEHKLKEEELLPLVRQWRAANPKVVAFWRDLEAAAVEAVKTGKLVQAAEATETPSGVVRTPYPCNISFSMDKGFLLMNLPSNRSIFYARPKIEINEWGKDAITYEGVDGETKQWKRQSAYGGMFTAHCIQGLAWDIICNGVEGAEAAGYPILLSVHDELIAEVPDGFGSVDEMIEIMSRTPEWANGLPLTASGAESRYYHK